jgi:hypothetical protein
MSCSSSPQMELAAATPVRVRLGCVLNSSLVFAAIVGVFACASASPRTETAPDAAASLDEPPTHTAVLAADGGSNPTCVGPGRYEFPLELKDWPRCCEGLVQVHYQHPDHDRNGYRVCGHISEHVFSCSAGECGDGICDEDESAPCGCTQDCSSAAWGDTDTLIAPSSENGFAEVPEDCSEQQLVAHLQTRSDAVECGALPFPASLEQTNAALDCVRKALATSQPFQVFWSTPGAIGVELFDGLIGRLQAGELRIFSLRVSSSDEVAIGFEGEHAKWWPCEVQVAPTCSLAISSCISLSFGNFGGCTCLPKGERPHAPPGAEVEVRCRSDRPPAGSD